MIIIVNDSGFHDVYVISRKLIVTLAKEEHLCGLRDADLTREEGRKSVEEKNESEETSRVFFINSKLCSLFYFGFGLIICKLLRNIFKHG